MSRIGVILLFVILLSSCGTTHLITSNPEVDIYVDNQFRGKGQTEVTRFGSPQKIHITAKYKDQEVAAMDAKRNIGFLTVVAALYTYGIGFFFTWYYPETIYIPVDIKKTKSFDQTESIWDKPPGGWKK